MGSYVWDVPMLMSHQYIDDHLEGKAESCPRPKPVLPGHDFVKLLHFHYREDDSEYPDGQQYAQQAALMIFDFLTGVRPSTTTKTIAGPDDSNTAKVVSSSFRVLDRQE